MVQESRRRPRRLGSGRVAALAFAFALAVPAAAESQDARLHVKLEDEGGQPVVGALVALVDTENQVRAEGLSSEGGRRTLVAPPGSYHIRVRRIGFRPFTAGPVSLPYEGELALRVESRRIVLDTVRVAARSRCRPAGRDAERLATVWEEVRKALRSSQLSVDDLIGIGLARSYRREVRLDGGVISSDTNTFVVRDRRPFGAIDPTALALEGYVRGDDRRGWEFFGPDETVLLSNEFANTHCFRLVRERSRPGQIGVAFEPEPGRRTADIAGVLWLDETTAELREMRYRFVAGGVLRGVEAGGFTRFRRMPSGAWLVEEWQLRMPRVAIAPGQREHIVAIGFIETGGGIVDRRTPAYGHATGTVSGVIYDSVSLRPLPGAVVTLGETVARTDDRGRFRFSGAHAGVHTISFTHPTLSNFGLLAVQRTIEVSGNGTEVALSTPSLARAWEQICEDRPPTDGRRAILHGVVLNDEGEPVSQVPVRINWTEARLQPGADAPAQVLELSTDSEGRFTACGFATAARGTASARSGALSGRRDFSFTPEQNVLRRDLILTRGERPTPGERRHEILVTVTDADGRPLADATVFLEGQAESRRTDDLGRAALRTTEPQVTIVARRLGFGEAVLRVTLGSSDRQQLRIPLSNVQALPEVVVRAAAPLPATIERRRNLARGVFYGPHEIAAAGELRNLLARTPGAAIEGTAQWAVRFRHPNLSGDCWADVYVDGQLWAPNVSSFGSREAGIQKTEALRSLGPSGVYAIEVYPRATQAPQEIVRLRDGCGAILVWTVGYVEAELARASGRGPTGLADTSRR
jgi:hypothetical protein